jgi:hypothetical protein
MLSKESLLASLADLLQVLAMWGKLTTLLLS